MLKFLLVVALFAVVVYAIAWTLERRRTLGKGNALPRRRPAAPPTKQVAPDDDEDFLRWLDRKQRKQPPSSRESSDPGAGDISDGPDGEGQAPAAS